MKKLLFLVLLSLPVIMHAQVKGECKKSNTFTHIQVYDGIVATFEHGDEDQLCPGTNTELDKLQISITDNVLRIRKIPGNKYENAPRILIKYTNLQSIEGYAKADLDTRNLIATDSLKILLKSGSRFYASCDVKYLDADVAEGSLLTIDGYAMNQNIQSASKATFSGFELEGDKAEVKALTGGIVKLNVEKLISGSASSGAYITYKNTPKTDVKTNTGGKIVVSD
jgi:hypothetical protein